MVDDFHLVDLTMAGTTTDATVDVYGVIEIGVIGQSVDLIPPHGRPTDPAVADFRQ